MAVKKNNKREKKRKRMKEKFGHWNNFAYLALVIHKQNWEL